MDGQITFNEWWAEFEQKHRNNKEGEYSIAEILFSEVSLFPEEKRTAFIDELLDRTDLHYYACKLIPQFGNAEQKNVIRKIAAELIDDLANYNIIEDYFKVILKTYSPDDHQLLKEYLLKFSGQDNFRIPLKVFSIDKDLFLQIFTLQLSELSADSICKYDGLLYLTSDVESLKFLIDNSDEEQSAKLKEFALAKSRHSLVAMKPGLKEKLVELSK